MQILKFNQFINEKIEDIDPELSKKPAVGVAIIYNNKILLVHPTGASWQRATCGIPKGGLNSGEDLMDGALRELREETGILLDRNRLDSEPHVVNWFNSKGSIDRQLIYFVCKIQNLSEIGLTSEKIDSGQLQLEEIDWAKFLTPEEAYPIMTRAQLIILDRHLEINK
jgi:predicted NUDIX family NTP pyrophosphohydrolase